MKVCLETIPPTLSAGIHRVANALAKYKPADVELVRTPAEADLWIIHVIGHGSLEELHAYDGKIAIIQYCLRTTEDPSTTAWMPHWQRAEAVWSYYDIEAYIRDHGDEVHQQAQRFAKLFNFYHAPLGVSSAFKPSAPARKPYLVGTSGYVLETEGVIECHAAARRLKGRHFHLGPASLNIGEETAYSTGVTDAELAEFWSQCKVVAGMRRIEGFELPVLEALACRTRPVCFDAPHYKHWFGEHAMYVPELPVGSPDLVEALVDAFQSAPPVGQAERDAVVNRFQWSNIAKGFWERLR